MDTSRGDDFDLWEPHIGSFVMRSEAQEPEHDGPLAGLSVGVKDIIDVAGMPTRNGSAACADAAPAEKDAAIVAALRAAGARIAGKTVTTEFAFTDPTECRNPHDLARSPGGSSSGSGAAVAAGLVDFALGTQTAGSLCRPAAYCGIVGLKPGYGTLPMAGVTPMAGSFDTLGILARSVELTRRVFETATGQGAGTQPDMHQIRCGVFSGDAVADPDAMAALEEAGVVLDRAGCAVSRDALPGDIAAIIDAHRCVMVREAFEVHGHFLASDRADLLRPNFRACLEEGQAIGAEHLAEARAALAEAKTAFWTGMQGVDAILSLPVPEGAPLIGGTTGFQGWLTPWTVFQGPLISLPWGRDGLGRPRAVLLASRPGTEGGLLALAARLEALAPSAPRPVLPV